MSVNRLNAIDTILNREIKDVDTPSHVISDFFGSNVFNDTAMKKHMDEKTYLSVKAIIQSGSKLDRKLAAKVAKAMKSWATAKGASHYAHWFQPLTGKTAEKHDSFFTLDLKDGSAIEVFEADALAQQEPDGSSFPGGGLRSTFEARGYTAWDPSSPAFILEVGSGKTLCIPTIFVTYSGQALDYKLPLLKSQSYLEEAAVAVCKYFDKKVKNVITTLGWEQEYFLVDEALFNARPDLVMTGRTLVGKHSTKGQQLDDHYFGSIPERIYAYMRDLETECHKLAIPVRTRHNEVGPGQYELAPMFEEVNVAVDHNQLLMDLMERVAYRHKLRVLLHEKPFEGVNGSGKHNNWSMATNTGKNLLSPGAEPGKNLRFLTFFVNTIMAVHNHANILRASVASASNDHRLGANEAPPAIISVFVGESLTKVLNAVEKGKMDADEGAKSILDLLSKVPNLEMDNTDRNRTSPFAFTGNKFEIRMVGSTMNSAAPMTVMNTIVGKQLRLFKTDVDKLIKKGSSKEAALFSVIKKYVKASKAIRFEGDNYSDDWKKEAKKRGLQNTPNTPTALDAYNEKSTIKLFSESGVLSKTELHAHYEVKVEEYATKMRIEADTLAELCMSYILPPAVEYQTSLAENVLSLKDLKLPKATYAAQLELIKELGENINAIKSNVAKLGKACEAAEKARTSRATAIAYSSKVKPIMAAIRTHTDNAEMLIDDKDWPLAKYRELMFIK